MANPSYMRPSSTPSKETGRILGTIFSCGGLDSTGALPEALVSPSELAGIGCPHCPVGVWRVDGAQW